MLSDLHQTETTRLCQVEGLDLVMTLYASSADLIRDVAETAEPTKRRMWGTVSVSYTVSFKVSTHSCVRFCHHVIEGSNIAACYFSSTGI